MMGECRAALEFRVDMFAPLPLPGAEGAWQALSAGQTHAVLCSSGQACSGLARAR